MLEAVKGFRRLKGHADMPKLVAALRARDQQLGIGQSVENVAITVIFGRKVTKRSDASSKP